MLLAVTPQGVITGFGFATASTKDTTLADTFLAAWSCSHSRLSSVGQPALGDYLADKSFDPAVFPQRWVDQFGAHVICAPKRNSRTRTWPKALPRWLAGLRQIVETVVGKLMNAFRLCGERPHHLTGFQAWLAAKVALHNFCIWFNRQLGRANLTIVDLVDW
jgi:hypothetical protein